MKEIDWEERHFQICLALLSRTDLHSYHSNTVSTVEPKLPMIIKTTDRMVELLKEHGSESEKPDDEFCLKVKWNGKKEGYINNEGNWVIEPIFDKAYPFDEDCAIIEIDGQFGLIDKYGAWIFRPIYSDLGVFSDGLAVASLSKKYGYINREGKWIIKPVYDEAETFRGGTAKVTDENGSFYIDKTGKFIKFADD